MKLYTYSLACSFHVQFTFSESEIEGCVDEEHPEIEPTDAALTALRNELQEVLGSNYSISSFHIHADPDCLLGIEEE